MRIAQVAPLEESVPPQQYGGIERVIYNLTESLVAMGHEVTLFASGDSETSADLVAVIDHSLRTSKIVRDPIAWHMRQLMEVVRMADKFDVVHFHTGFHHFPVWRHIDTPQVTTLHSPLSAPDLGVIFDEFSEMAVVSISDSQRKPLPGANWVATVYNGTPANHFHLRTEPGDYLVFLGRFSPEKGPEQAIEIARRVGLPLKMAAKIDPVDRAYFAEKIEPVLDDPLIEYLGEVDERGKDQLLGGALALLFPINWPEPFGLVMTESMACGTPVIAMRKGSVEEVMRDGVSGFIVDDVEQAIAAVGRVRQIDRAACRRYFEERFSVKRMAEQYVNVYRDLCKSSPSLVLPANGTATSTTLATGGE